MNYSHILSGKFLARPNRFIAQVEINGQLEVCHVKNTGRCQELLLPGAIVYVEESSNPNRKTRFSLVAVQKGNRLINMDSQAPNLVFAEWVQSGHFLPGLSLLRREVSYRSSRFDFYCETAAGEKAFVEVKGVTLEKNGVALFPDAPTLRGVKHVEELCSCVQDGFSAYLFFVVQMSGVCYFTPNTATHPEFTAILCKAQHSGVHLRALDCAVSPDSLVLQNPVPIHLP